MLKWEQCMVKLLGQFARYMGHVSSNVGGIYEIL